MTKRRLSALVLAPLLVLVVMVAGLRAGSRHTAHGEAGAAAASMRPDSTRPEGESRLLFFQGRATVGTGDERVFVTDGGRLAAAGTHLRVRYLGIDSLDAATMSIAPARDAGWWLADVNGQLLRVDSAGQVTERRPAPFAVSVLWPHGDGGVVAVRSPERFSFAVEATGAPLFSIIEANGTTHAVGTASVPEHTLLTSVANAGHVLSLGGNIYFAPLGRPELLAMNSAGELLWRLESPDPVLAVEPRFVVADGSVRIDHNPLNLALTLGEDGQLYRLRARDTSGQEAVLDIVSPEDGRIVRSIPVGSARLTLALGPAGRLHLLDDATLLGAVAPGDRESLPAFDWPSRQGERVTSADLPGRVALINVWASWCTPCRREMPALDSLQQVLRGETFQFIALNADAQRADADAYLAQFPFTFPVVYGGTQTASVFRYPGLPYTLLVDADGRIMRRWAGQLMPRDMEQIHALVRAEQLRIAASTVVTDGNEHAGHRPE